MIVIPGRRGVSISYDNPLTQMKLILQVDSLNVEKAILTQQPLNPATMLTQEKKMALCEICGSFLVANDAMERTQSHITGKQHIGYGLVRDFIAEFKV